MKVIEDIIADGLGKLTSKSFKTSFLSIQPELYSIFTSRLSVISMTTRSKFICIAAINQFPIIDTPMKTKQEDQPISSIEPLSPVRKDASRIASPIRHPRSDNKYSSDCDANSHLSSSGYVCFPFWKNKHKVAPVNIDLDTSNAEVSTPIADSTFIIQSSCDNQLGEWEAVTNKIIDKERNKITISYPHGYCIFTYVMVDANNIVCLADVSDDDDYDIDMLKSQNTFYNCIRLDNILIILKSELIMRNLAHNLLEIIVDIEYWVKLCIHIRSPMLVLHLS
jgi:hypothetical protein